jgi:hypothetical protein
VIQLTNTTTTLDAQRMKCWRLAAMALQIIAAAAGVSQAAHTVESLVSGLNQPMYVTQAPGEHNSLYIVERNDGGNQLGRVRRFDLQTQQLTTFLDVTGSIVADGGLLSMTFHPEYQSNGTFYVVTNNNQVNGLDEYRVINGTPQFERRLLEYDNLVNNFHTMNQAFFRPGGNNNELFVTTGDGGTQANQQAFDIGLIESPTSPYGKVMKIDLSQPFAAPATAPGPGTGVSVVALGIRNPYRGSFDRQTGDFYFGDVGFNTVEEVDFIPASHFDNPSPPILDFGWTDREGTIETVASQAGGPGSPGDINPIFDYAHGGQPLPHNSLIHGGSVTGGYVYRGPVPEFQGRYFFSDFINGSVYSGSFDANTTPANFDGTNLTDLEDHTGDFEALAGGADIRFVTSFGEDNAGNLYIVKFGNDFFPSLGEGEIFRVAPVLSSFIEVDVDRDTGAISMRNASAEEIAFSSLTITSGFGAIDPDALTPISDNYDQDDGGEIDMNDTWTITSPAGSHTLFSESSTGDPGAIEAGEQIELSSAGGWIPSPNEDLFVSLQLGDSTILNATVSYTGNAGNPFPRSDLNFDGDITIDDWSLFLSNAFGNLSGLSRAQAYALGDLDADGDNDRADFLLFKSDFNTANGAGAFDRMVLGVPEPGTLLLALACTTWLYLRRRSPLSVHPDSGM